MICQSLGINTTSLAAQLVKNLPAMQETPVQFLGWEDSLEKGNAYPLEYPGLENSTDCIVHGIAKSWTRLGNFHFHFDIHIKDSSLYSFHRLTHSRKISGSGQSLIKFVCHRETLRI